MQKIGFFAFWSLSALIAALTLSLTLIGCATVTTPSGFTIKYPVIPFVNTTGAVSYSHEWLSEENELHEERLLLGGNVDSQRQLDAFKLGAAAASAAIKGAGL